MKYIKYFEDRENEYKDNDYVLLAKKAIQKYNNMIDNKGKIFKIVYPANEDMFTIIEVFLNNNKLIHLSFANDEIERKLTEEEIDEYEMKINVKNFNL